MEQDSVKEHARPGVVPIITLPGITLSDSVYRPFPPVDNCKSFFVPIRLQLSVGNTFLPALVLPFYACPTPLGKSASSAVTAYFATQSCLIFLRFYAFLVTQRTGNCVVKEQSRSLSPVLTEGI